MFSSNDDVPSVDNPKPKRTTMLDTLRFGKRDAAPDPAEPSASKPRVEAPPRRWLGIVMVWLWFMVIAVSYTFAWYVKRNLTEGNAVDTRPCALAVKDYQLTGKRTYSYHFYEIFGWRFIDTRTIFEETILDVKGEPMTIIGQNPGDWWSVKVGDGEFGVQRIKNADTYSVIVGDNRDVAVVPYHGLCK